MSGCRFLPDSHRNHRKNKSTFASALSRQRTQAAYATDLTNVIAVVVMDAPLGLNVTKVVAAVVATAQAANDFAGFEIDRGVIVVSVVVVIERTVVAGYLNVRGQQVPLNWVHADHS